MSEDWKWGMCGQGRWIWTGNGRDGSGVVSVMRDSARSGRCDTVVVGVRDFAQWIRGGIPQNAIHIVGESGEVSRSRIGVSV